MHPSLSEMYVCTTAQIPIVDIRNQGSGPSDTQNLVIHTQHIRLSLASTGSTYEHCLNPLPRPLVHW